jgi:hypothetical protein
VPFDPPARALRHRIRGRLPSVSNDLTTSVACTGCHASAPHASERLNSHVRTVACETCHVPRFAVEAATKMSWDWSTAGRDVLDADPHLYSKMKGTFTFAKQVVPEYRWHNGLVDRYVPGEAIDPDGVTEISRPFGDPRGRRLRGLRAAEPRADSGHPGRSGSVRVGPGRSGSVRVGPGRHGGLPSSRWRKECGRLSMLRRVPLLGPAVLFCCRGQVPCAMDNGNNVQALGCDAIDQVVGTLDHLPKIVDLILWDLAT